MKHSLVLILSLSLLSFSFPALAATSPLGVSVVPPVQFPADDFSITGARFSLLWGRHRHFYGLDIGGIGNITDQEFVGLSLAGVFNATHGTTSIIGLQAAGAANINTNKTSVYGIQFALGVNSNSASSKVVGVQAALLANLSQHTDIYGVQMGLYNKAQTVRGLQIGLVNVATSLYGLQIGLVNFHHKGIFAVSPIVNIGF